MGYIEGTSLDQTTYWSMEELVAVDSMARVIDRFIKLQDLKALGFTRTEPSETGRPGYPPGPLVKLYVYGYENGIRSSRKLEKEAKRNMEVMWLTEGLMPDHKTISEFREQSSANKPASATLVGKHCELFNMVICEKN